LTEGALLTPFVLQLLKSTPTSPTTFRLKSFVLTTAVNVSLLLSNTVTVFSDDPVADEAPPTAYFSNNSWVIVVTPLPANHNSGVIPSFTSLTVIATLAEPLNPPASVTLTTKVIVLLLNAS
jgi:acyl-CoA synthetase (AMP-forming)/AMP-acid ligase II